MRTGNRSILACAVLLAACATTQTGPVPKSEPVNKAPAEVPTETPGASAAIAGAYIEALGPV